MGCYGAIVSAYQALCGVLCNGLQVSMVAKTRIRHGIDSRGVHHRDAEVIALGGATVLGVAVAITAPLVTDHLLRLPLRESAQWLRIIVAALPFMILNRAAAYTAIGEGDYRRATKVVLVVAAVMTPVFAVAVPLFGPAGAASASLMAESITALVVVVTVIHRQTRSRVRGRHRALDRDADPAAVH
jgi:Na+-driven multidrug efflux pump